jgi:hypothetical protein
MREASFGAAAFSSKAVILPVANTIPVLRLVISRKTTFSGDEVSTVTQLRRISLISGPVLLCDPRQSRYGTDLIARLTAITSDSESNL